MITSSNRDLIRKKNSSKKSRSPKVDFLAHVSHEIRNPLYGIIGSASLLGKTFLSEEQKIYIRALESSSRALMGMVDDVLDYAKFSKGIFEIHPKTFCLKALSLEVVQVFFGTSAEKNLQLECTFDEKIYGDGFFGDSERIRQVLMNLVSNGVKYTDCGQVLISWRVLQDLPRSQILRCEVRDTGKGIPLDFQRSIFEPFFRTDHSLKTPGAGLGLSISKMIIEKLEGRIGLNCDFEGGSTFWFEITLQKSACCHSKENVSNTGVFDFDFSLFKVLVAEDNEVNQTILSRMLSEMGAYYKIVSDGREVLRALEAERFDLVLLDCYMSAMDGFQTAQAIRSVEESYRNIPLLAFTASSARGDRERCLQAGMNDVLLKPATYEQLFEKLKSWGQICYESMPVLDETALEKISLCDDEAQSLLPTLLQMFQENTEEELQRMQVMLKSSDNEGLRKKAHKLKSSAAQLGARRLQKSCHLLETEESLDCQKAARLLQKVNFEYGESLRKFRAYCQKHDQNAAALM